MKNQTNKKPNPKKTQTGPSSLLIWASIILFIIASFAFLPDESANEVEVSYNTYKELLAENKIKEASIENDNSFHGELFNPQTLINNMEHHLKKEPYLLSSYHQIILIKLLCGMKRILNTILKVKKLIGQVGYLVLRPGYY